MRIGLQLALAALLVVLGFGPVASAWAQPTEDGREMPPLPRPRPNIEGTSAQPGGTPQDNAASNAITAATTVPQPVHFSAKIIADSQPIPDGVIWRVFDAKPAADGQMAMIAKSDKAAADFSLPPGNYVVHAAYGRAQISQNVTVGTGDNDQVIVFNAGALRLNAAVTGDIAIPLNLLRFNIYAGDGTETERDAVAEGVTPNDIVTLNAGTYHIVSYFGDINAVVRADLRVEPGQLTEATLYHRAAQVQFKLVSEAGGEAIADVDWTVKTSDGQTVFTNIGAFPSTVLAEGDYEVLAKRGETVYNRAFEVTAGQPREIEVLTSVYAPA